MRTKQTGRYSWPKGQTPILNCPACKELLEIPPVPATEQDRKKMEVCLNYPDWFWEEKWMGILSLSDAISRTAAIRAARSHIAHRHSSTNAAEAKIIGQLEAWL